MSTTLAEDVGEFFYYACCCFLSPCCLCRCGGRCAKYCQCCPCCWYHNRKQPDDESKRLLPSGELNGSPRRTPELVRSSYRSHEATPETLSMNGHAESEEVVTEQPQAERVTSPNGLTESEEAVERQLEEEVVRRLSEESQTAALSFVEKETEAHQYSATLSWGNDEDSNDEADPPAPDPPAPDPPKTERKISKRQALLVEPSVAEAQSFSPTVTEEPSEDERIVLFEWRKPANDVQLVGSFNDWTPERMTKSSEGPFYYQKWLKVGRYEYKFVVNGKWSYDETQPFQADKKGKFNNVVQVK